MSESLHQEVKGTTQTLVDNFNEATQIIDFFSKPEEIKRMKKEIKRMKKEIKRMKKEIKRAILECSFADKGIASVVQERFLELAKTKFK